MFKKYAFFTALCFSYITSFAGHEIGGIIIRYESVAHVNNNPLEYVLYMYSIYDKQGPGAPNNANVQLSSSCFSNTSFSLPIVSNGGSSFLPLTGADYCSSNATIQNGYGLALYRDTITLPGQCGDFMFSVAAGYGRFNTTINMANSFAQNYFETSLNNIPGPNSSATIPLSQFIQATCTNKLVSFYNYTDVDGDSLFISKSTPLIQNGSSTSSIPYATGYSQANQTNSSVGYSMTNATGQVQTNISASGTYLLSSRYNEYRLDTNLNQMVLVGHSIVSTVVIASSSCTPLPFLLSYPAGSNTDSLDCASNTIKVAASRKITRTSLTSNGSEFEIRSSKQGAIGIQNAIFLNDSTIELTLNQSLGINDTVWVLALNGSDNNTLLSTCGQEITVQADTLYYYTPAQSTVVASFAHTNTLLQVDFMASMLSTNAIQYNWDFGDGSSASTQADPTHVYGTEGTYNVRLAAQNSCGIWDTTVKIVHVCDVLSGSFNYTFANDSIVLSATSSSATANQFIWNFGDGNLGNGVNVKHKYASSGSYLISLLIVNLCGDSLVYTDSVQACAAPTADWTYTIISSSSTGMTVSFDGTASTNASNFLWSFGDGSTNNTSLTPTHVYATPSLTYKVSLTVTNACGNSGERSFRLNEISLAENKLLPVGLYPNPSNGQVHLEIEEEVHVEVYNAAGALMRKPITVEKSGIIDLTKLPKGVYYFNIVGENTNAQIAHIIQ